MTEKRKRICDFVEHGNEKALNRILDVIENIESPVLAYTQTGEPILKEDLSGLTSPEAGRISQEDFDKRLAVLNGQKASENVLA